MEALKHMPTACIIMNQHARIIGMNKAAANMFETYYLTTFSSLQLEMEFYPYFDKLIEQIAGNHAAQTEAILRNAKNKELHVRIGASVISYAEKCYLFQITEIKTFLVSDYFSKLINLFRKKHLQAS